MVELEREICMDGEHGNIEVSIEDDCVDINVGLDVDGDGDIDIGFNTKLKNPKMVKLIAYIATVMAIVILVSTKLKEIW